jgi:D-alanyl-D-alanine-carboxypeptidase/D-alanyl-D-alanine-endopeptidase
MSDYARVACLVAAMLSAAASLAAQPSEAEVRQILVDRVDVRHASVGMVAGIVAPNGRLVVSYGNLGGPAPQAVNGDTVFEVGSVTKLFTALLLADMVVRGEVGLNDPVKQYLPGNVRVAGKDGRAITLADLATHTSGLPFFPSNFPPVEDRAAYAKYSVEQLYQSLSSELPRAPGTRWEYSNTGGGLLGLALSRRAGMDYESLVRARITGPLGLESTVIGVPPPMKPRLAVGHDDQLGAAPNWDLPALPGAGSLHSTATDLLDLLAAFLGYTKSPLAPAMAAMPETSRPNELFGINQALGWFVIGKGDERIFIHEGGTFGFASCAAYDPKTRVGVVVLSNASPSVGDIARHLVRASFPLDAPAARKQRREIAVDAGLFDLYAGQYDPGGGWTYTVTHEGDGLRIQLPAAPRYRLFAETERDFFLKETDIQVTFKRDDNGRVTGLILHLWGMNLPAKRLQTPK